MIEEKIKEYSVKVIAEKTGISEPTIYRYMKDEGIEGHIKFIQFLEYLKIDIQELIKHYEIKNNKKG